MPLIHAFLLLSWLALVARHPAAGLALGAVIVVWPFIKRAVRLWPRLAGATASAIVA